MVYTLDFKVLNEPNSCLIATYFFTIRFNLILIDFVNDN